MKPSIAVSMDIPIPIDPIVSASVVVRRDGQEVDLKQEFLTPTTSLLSIGDILVHRINGRIFRVVHLRDGGITVEDPHGRDQTDVDFGTVEQSCWLLKAEQAG